MFQRDLHDKGRKSERGSGKDKLEDAPEGSDLPPVPGYDELDLSWGKAKMPDFEGEPATSLPVAEMSGDKVYAAADAVDSTDATVITLADKGAEKDGAKEGNTQNGEEAKKRPVWIPLVIIIAALALLAGAWFTVANFTDLFARNVAARVNGEVVTVSELDDRLEIAQAQNPAMFDPNEDGLEAGMARQLLLDTMINDLLLLQEAARQDVQVSDQEIQDLIDMRIASYPSEEDFEEDLRAHDMTRDMFREQVRIGMTLEALMVIIVPDEEITAEEIREYYDEHIEFYTEPPTEDGEEGAVIPFEEVAPAIHDMLVTSLRNIMRGDLLERLRDEGNIEILDPVVAEFIEAGGGDEQGIMAEGGPEE